MKTQKLFSAVALTAMLFLFATTSSFAQRGVRAERGERRPQAQLQSRSMEYCENIPDLTEEQKEAIQELRTARLKESTEHRNKIEELRARKRTLMSSDNPDMTEVDKIIDEMSDLRNQHLKNAARHHQEVRSLLTEEQRVYFDARGPKNKGKMKNKANRPARGQRRR
ncbi:MAG: Spy/CpxP family protein refolding chaperone [Bacteroidota bacterium]